MDYLTHYGATLPEGFVAQIEQLYGADADRFLQALGGKPSVGVRVNPLRHGAMPSWFDAAQPVSWSVDGFTLAERPDFTLSPQLHAGAFYVQEPASMVIGKLLQRVTDGRPVRILEVCAAPGGKTTAMLSAMPRGSLLVSNEYVGARAKILSENVVKWGSADTIVTNADAASLGQLEGMFDILVIDAPCSGEGMMRKEPKALEQWSEGLIRQCAALQREIVADAIAALRPGGVLIYSTCTYNRAENEENAEWIADSFGMERVETGLDLPRGFSDKVECFRFSPFATDSEGLFVAIMRRPGNLPARTENVGKKARQKGADVKIPDWLAASETFRPIEMAGSWSMLPAAHADMYNSLEKRKIRILNAGVETCTQKGKDLIPAHALALAVDLRDGAFAEVEVDEPTALDYLRRNAITLPDGTPKGYVLITYCGNRLGFVKNLGPRSNNLYPSPFKIRYR